MLNLFQHLISSASCAIRQLGKILNTLNYCGVPGLVLQDDRMLLGRLPRIPSARAPPSSLHNLFFYSFVNERYGGFHYSPQLCGYISSSFLFIEILSLYYIILPLTIFVN